MGNSVILLIVVSGLLLVFIIFTVVLFLNLKKNQGTKNQAPSKDNYIPPVNESIINNYMQPFTVFKQPEEGQSYVPDRQSGGIQNRADYNSGTQGMGVAAQEPAFYGGFSEEHEGTVLLDSESIRPANPSFSGNKGITVQYYRNGAVQNFGFSGPFAIIGRDADCDIIIDTDTFLSKHHAMLLMKNGALCIADLNSKNGSFINEKRIDGVVHLNGSEKIVLASSEIKVFVTY